MIPWPGVEVPFWRKDAFWAGVYLLVMLYAVVRGTWGKDEAARRPVLRRVLIAAGAFGLIVHVWAGWSLVTDLRGLSVTLGPRLTPMDQSRVVDDALVASAGSWALLAATVAACALWSRPVRIGGRVRWNGYAVAAALVLVAALVPLEGRFDPRFPPLMGRTLPEPTWVERACLLGALTALLAVLVLVATAVGRLFGRGGRGDAPESELGRELTLWGFLLIVGTILLMERRAMDYVMQAALLGPRFGGWGGHVRAYFGGGILYHSFLLVVGLVALSFGTLHLRRHRVVAPEETPQGP